MNRLEVWAPDGLPEIDQGHDLVALIADATDLTDGDIVVVTSKIISKAEGRVTAGDRAQALAAQTVRVVARRGPTTIVRNRLGLTMAAAGIDASNVAAGTIALLPEDPDASARRLRAGLLQSTGANLGVVITDTAGRAWREGQTDIAIGAAGVVAVHDFEGQLDPYGNLLKVTRTALLDEIAAAAELVQSKLGRRPVAVLRGRGDLVLSAGEDGQGARALIRAEHEDLFAFGAREAVIRALAAEQGDLTAFGEPVPAVELVEALARVDPERVAVAAVCFSHGWSLDEWVDDGTHAVAKVSPATP